MIEQVIQEKAKAKIEELKYFEPWIKTKEDVLFFSKMRNSFLRGAKYLEDFNFLDLFKEVDCGGSLFLGMNGRFYFEPSHNCRRFKFNTEKYIERLNVLAELYNDNIHTIWLLPKTGWPDS